VGQTAQIECVTLDQNLNVKVFSSLHQSHHSSFSVKSLPSAGGGKEEEEEKKESEGEWSVEVYYLSGERKQQFKRVLSFLNQSIIGFVDFQNFPFISVQVSNGLTLSVIRRLADIEEGVGDLSQHNQLHKSVINEFSCYRLSHFLKENLDGNKLRMIPQFQKKLRTQLEEIQAFYRRRFLQILEKHLLIKFTQSILSQKKLDKYFLSDQPVSYEQIKPTQIFEALTTQLQKLIQSS